MKKISLAAIALLSAISFVSNAQTWSGSTPGNIYYNSGNVGIGTSTPAYRLTVVGGVYVLQSVNSDYLLFDHSGVNTWRTRITTDNTSSYIIGNDSGGTFNTKVLTLTQTGNVGIGTTSPSAKLDITNMLSGAHPASTPLIRIVDGYNAGANGQFFQIVGAGDGTHYTNVNLLSNYGYLSLGAREDATATPTNSLNILSNGKVGIGTTTPDQLLSVNGTIHSKEVKVDLVNLPDYVFKPTYRLPKLADVKVYIDKYQHLPEIPSASEAEANGLNLGEMNKLLLKKVEELTLYLIEKDKKDAEQQRQIDQLKRKMASHARRKSL